MRCPHCGQEHPDGSVFCPSTGGKLAGTYFCVNCGTEIQPAWKVCPKCGAPVEKMRNPDLGRAPKTSRGRPGSLQAVGAGTNRHHTPILIGGVAFSLLIAVGLYFYFARSYQATRVRTLPSPLKDVEFPAERASYPADWPSDLIWPKEFKLVDSASGTLPGSTSKGWSAKFRYSGELSGAVKAVSGFLEGDRWTVVQTSRLDSGAWSVLLERSQGSAIVVMDSDPDDASQTLVIATFLP